MDRFSSDRLSGFLFDILADKEIRPLEKTGSPAVHGLLGKGKNSNV